nr:hypothetical protein [Lachnospiraceae bacterium]
SPGTDETDTVREEKPGDGETGTADTEQDLSAAEDETKPEDIYGDQPELKKKEKAEEASKKNKKGKSSKDKSKKKKTAEEKFENLEEKEFDEGALEYFENQAKPDADKKKSKNKKEKGKKSKDLKKQKKGSGKEETGKTGNEKV